MSVSLPLALSFSFSLLLSLPVEFLFCTISRNTRCLQVYVHWFSKCWNLLVIFIHSNHTQPLNFFSSSFTSVHFSIFIACLSLFSTSMFWWLLFLPLSIVVVSVLRCCCWCVVGVVVQIENLFLWGPLFKTNFPFLYRQRCELTARSDEKKNTCPAGDRTWIFRLPVGRYDHRATKPRRELRANFSYFTKLSVLVFFSKKKNSGNKKPCKLLSVM